MKIRDRIKELRRVPASQLQPNPKNWRTHPAAQQDSLKAVLAEIGYADALLARETPEGGLMLIDGHLRAETTPDQPVPVLILDVDESEADKLLATLDPLAAMAGADGAKIAELLRDVKTGSAALQDMLTRLAADAGAIPEFDPAADSEPNLDTRYAIVVNCESEQQQLDLLEQFEKSGLDCRALVV
jgi:ParB-like chromosome segregation protein Spo0J